MGNKNQIDAMAADIHSLIRSDAISRALASLLCDKGYCKASEVAREMCGMLREDLKGEVDMEYLERLLTIYEKNTRERENEIPKETY